jgi:hypothetical protein
MKLFAVFKQGVYRHECGGIYDSIELAKKSANTFCESDYDSYHCWEVVEFELNEPTPAIDDNLVENQPIYTVRKK